MLVEAARAASRAPGPPRAFFLRVQARRGKPGAAVATARELAVLAWHPLAEAEGCAWARPALLEAKQFAGGSLLRRRVERGRAGIQRRSTSSR